MPETKSAFIAIVGRPNVGKSSILNRLLGQKVAIVSSKPQTTRTRIMGVLTRGDTQLVFTDTPGFHRPGNKLGEKMVKAVGDSIADVDACMLVTEPEEGIRPAERELVDKFRASKLPVLLVINKIDTLHQKEPLIRRMAEWAQVYDFDAVLPVSAQTGEGLDALEKELMGLARESIWFFPDDTLTDQPERVLAAEMIREKALRLLQKESRTASRSKLKRCASARAAILQMWRPSSTAKRSPTRGSSSERAARCSSAFLPMPGRIWSASSAAGSI